MFTYFNIRTRPPNYQAWQESNDKGWEKMQIKFNVFELENGINVFPLHSFYLKKLRLYGSLGYLKRK